MNKIETDPWVESKLTVVEDEGWGAKWWCGGLEQKEREKLLDMTNRVVIAVRGEGGEKGVGEMNGDRWKPDLI